MEFTFPGDSNPAITGLTGPAGSDGAWRNITKAGIQDLAGFTERADGLLVYIPGFGASGVLLSLAGGTNDTFTQMNEVDVYDIETSNWYSQATSGPTPEIRVNPCAVVAAAEEQVLRTLRVHKLTERSGSSYQVYMYGGQNLIPYGNQTQYSDMWILSVPSFTWIQVNTSQQSTPYARAGHTCDVWDAQMVVVGGYIDPTISCESPGVYIFDLSTLQWVNTFTALASNPFSQQPSQQGTGPDAGLHGSAGYSVPAAVYSVIGGAATGGATVTAPLAQATAGPLATGHALTYTVTDGAGGTVTETAVAMPGSGGARGGGQTNVGAAAAGAVAGVLAVLAGYLAFCAVVYRKQLRRHAAALTAAAAAANRGSAAVAAKHQQRASAWSSRAGWLPAGAFAAKEDAGTEAGPRWSGGTASTGAGGGTRPASGGNEEGPLGPADSSEDLLGGFEPSYWGVLLHPRRSLKVVNR
jgi:hypothetical protein